MLHNENKSFYHIIVDIKQKYLKAESYQEYGCQAVVEVGPHLIRVILILSCADSFSKKLVSLRNFVH